MAKVAYSGCVLYSGYTLMIFLQIVTSLNQPDFESSWLELRAQSVTDNTVTVKHGLGDAPLLVDVLVKSLDKPNLGYIFPAVGVFPRDDDNAEMFGGVAYIYNQEKVIVAAPHRSDHYSSGRAIYTSSSGYVKGPNSQESKIVKVKVRAWRATSLPAPDFHRRGIYVKAASTHLNETYVEVNHNLGEYPALVIVRTRFTDGDMIGYRSDSTGSSFVAYAAGQLHKCNSAFFGYSQQKIRVWLPSSSNGQLFEGFDGYSLPAVARAGELEMFVWSQKSLGASLTKRLHIGPNEANEKLELPLPYNFSNNPLMKVMAETSTGPNTGFRFPGSGVLVYEETRQDSICTYGGLTYAYDVNNVRLWRPTNVTNGGVVCVPSMYGQATNAESNSDVTAVVQAWVLYLNLTQFDWQEVVDTCKQNH